VVENIAEHGPADGRITLGQHAVQTENTDQDSQSE